MRDPHRILGVPPDATREEVRRAYRALARAHHPDATGGAASGDRFAEISAAYEQMLKRADGFGRTAHPSAPGRTPDPRAADPEEAGEVYDSFFSSGSARASAGPRSVRGGRLPFTRCPGTLDLELELPISAAEAASGAVVSVPAGRARVEITIPPGAVTGGTVRVPGSGMRAQAGKSGDLVVRFRVVPGSGDPLDLGSSPRGSDGAG